MERTYTLTDKQGQRHPLMRLEFNQGKETSGVFIAMEGNQDNQIAELMNKLTATKVFLGSIRWGPFFDNFGLR